MTPDEVRVRVVAARLPLAAKTTAARHTARFTRVTVATHNALLSSLSIRR